jgi:hypothetical protein
MRHLNKQAENFFARDFKKSGPLFLCPPGRFFAEFEFPICPANIV